MLPCPRRRVGAVVSGCPPDKGVMVEPGMAIAWEEPVFPPPGRCPALHGQRDVSLNPMLLIGLPGTGRDASRHALIGELADPEEAPGRRLTGP